MTEFRRSRSGASPAARPALSLDTEATFLKGAGPAVAQRLRGLGILRVRDLLFHLPLRYEDRRKHQSVARLRPDEDALVLGRIVATDVRIARRRVLRVVIDDGTGGLSLRFFHFNEAQRKNLIEGHWMQVFGTVRAGTAGPEMVHPQYRVADSAEALQPERDLTPIYPLTTGITQQRMRGLIEQALRLAATDAELAQALPGLDGPPTPDALKVIHRPHSDEDARQLLEQRHPAQRRLVREELLAHQLGMRLLRSRLKSHPAHRLLAAGDAVAELQSVLTFSCTGAQQRVLAETAADLQREHPMLRLVQGDVGSGKTVIAAAALLAAYRSGLQAALVAPTELLAEQHLRNLSQWFGALGITPLFLANRMKKAERAAVLAQLAADQPAIVIGTHAVFQEQVTFSRLALAVVDEQHRFGVQQRIALRDKGGTRAPHQLIMSATPIPRTLAQTVYADLDVSVIDELPPGRTPVVTVVLSNERRDEVLRRIGEACAAGRQVYWVCTLIEESEELDAEAAEATAARLRNELPTLHVGLVHGRMKSADKDAQMRAFKDGISQLLVATTVIEVGVDVPNASIMVIENAERLGLAQLHQLRGRVGRGAQASQCVLLYQPPMGDIARARLETMRSTTDGFAIAQRDLELRGPGELLGRRQTGDIGMKLADPMRDAALIPPLQSLADRWLIEHPALARALIARWVGDPERYAQV
ncbi:ATP-dependent DNA helicase RecG [Sinimarinibacterium sp. CAU 1509]|uniref:ATP-dependent DNA helicase RecG n=1 Tax=Sinimarinibacterium sp. CAU 1509 TaxID=2562283 RepID=UPI0010AD9415|nr:ATP-dependent DNA helicase RecG [Sinimarinibacterium sp. CAU 1509]TJY58947.1 ATP-dependent DNA helicase RecG [Sinimarinibacterium sp. CAU 1509]